MICILTKLLKMYQFGLQMSNLKAVDLYQIENPEDGVAQIFVKIHVGGFYGFSEGSPIFWFIY